VVQVRGTDVKVKRMARTLMRAWLKIVSVPVVVAVTVASIPLVGGCSSSATRMLQSPPDPKALQQQARKVTGAEKLTKSLESLNSLAAVTSKRLSKGKSVTSDLSEFAGIREDLNRIDKTIGAEFAKTRKVLAKIKSPAKNKIQRRVERDYARRMATTKRLVSAIASVKDAKKLSAKKKSRLVANLSRLSRFIDWVTPEEPHQPLGTELPHRIVDYNAGPPTLGTNIAPAYAPNTPGAEPSNLPRTPTADDTSETIEVQFTEDISATANELEKNPVKMYEFVRNTMSFEPYYGSRKGANETLLEKGGNDFDQASLLIALFRYCGIPARYVQGVVDVPIAKAMNWVGVEKPEVALKLFSSAGVPVTGMTKGGRIAALRIEHVWTEVYLDYQNYRGVPTGSSSSKKRWIALDPSFKQYERKAPMDIESAAGIDAEELVTTDTAAIQQKLQQCATDLAVYIEERMPNATIGDVVGEQLILKRELGLLPSALPVRATFLEAEHSALSDDLRTTLRIAIGGQAEALYEAPLAELAGKRMTVYYSPVSEADVELLQLHGGLYSTPAYLVQARAVLLIDGEPVAVGGPRFLGVKEPAWFTFDFADGATMTVDKQLSAGSYYGLTLDLGVTTGEMVGARRLLLAEATEEVSSGAADVDVDRITGELLNVTSRLYWSQVDVANCWLANQAGIRVVREPSIASAAFQSTCVSMYGAPIGLQPAVPNIDVLCDQYLVHSTTGDTSASVGWMKTTGYVGSGAEHAVFEELYQMEAVSTVKLLSEATSQGVPVRVMTSNNLADELPLLQVSESVKAEVANAVGQGHEVTIPQRPVTYHDWQGVGWIDMDPETGNAGFMIAGVAGGWLAVLQEWLSKGLGLMANLAQATVRKATFVCRGVEQSRWRDVLTKEFVGGIWLKILGFIDLVLIPIVAAYQQFMEDLAADPSGDPMYRFDKALLTFLVYFYSAWTMSKLFAGLSPPWNVVATAVVSLFIDAMWNIFKEEVFKYLGHGWIGEAAPRTMMRLEYA